MTQLEPRTDGISNTLSTVQKDNLLMILDNYDLQEQEEIDECNKAIEESEKEIRKRGVDYFGREINPANLNQRIRRLTPRECMRLQGVPDYITDKLIQAGISDTQMYRAAGDACTVNVIYEVAKRM